MNWHCAIWKKANTCPRIMALSKRREETLPKSVLNKVPKISMKALNNVKKEGKSECNK